MTVQYSTAVGGARRLTLLGEVLRDGDFFLNAHNQADGFQDAYTLLNGRAVFDFNERWGISVWGKNLDDEIYLTRLFDLSDNPLVAHKLISLGAPRRWGVEARLSF